MFRRKMKLINTEEINMNIISSFNPVNNDEYHNDHCYKYFTDMKSFLLNNNYEEISNSVLFIIKPVNELKNMTDVYVGNKIKLLKEFNVKVEIISLSINEFNQFDAIKELGIELKRLSKKYKSLNKYFMLQKDDNFKSSDGNDFYRDFYNKLNKSIIKNNLDIIDVELLDSSIIDENVINEIYNRAKKPHVGKEILVNPLIGPCTPIGALNMLIYYDKLKHNSLNLIYGRSDILGKPLYDALLKLDHTPIICHSKSNPKFIRLLSKRLNNIFLCLDHKDFINKDNIDEYGKSTNIIDFGINFDENGKLCGNISKDVINSFSCRRIKTPTPSGTALCTLIQIVVNIYNLNLYRKSK